MNNNSITNRVLFALQLAASIPAAAAAGPSLGLNPNVVAVVGMTLAGIQGFINVVIPEANLKAYGWVPSKENLAVVKTAGTAALSTTAMHYQLLINKSSEDDGVNSALAVGILVRLVFVLDYLLRGHDKLIGTKKEGTMFWLALNTVVLVGLVFGWESSSSGFGIQAVAAMIFFSGSQMALDPKHALQTYGTKTSISTEFGLLVEALGGILAGSGLSTYAIATGKDATTAVGYSFIPLTLTLIKSVFITRQYQKANMDTTPLIGWIVMSSILVATLSF
mmetsp:Transcript_14532/g.35140  ORF Transcript_14532/g.35140 Transcript_14532/m.35140 type:complete len:278 (-) Transcript_14532:98-931(-)